MRSEFLFFIKASPDEFTFDTSAFKPEIIHQSPCFLFMANDTHNVQIFVLKNEVQITLGHPDLAFAKIIWNESTRNLTVTIDELGLMSLFYHKKEKVTYLSNRIEVLEKTLSSRDLSLKSIAFFLVSGFLPPGWSFWKEISRVEPTKSWSSHFLNQSEEQNWPSHYLQAIQSSLQLIHHHVDPEQIRLSGGADSRITSALWTHPLTAVVVQSPWLNSGEDLDVNLSKAWAELRGWPHRVLYPTHKDFAFFLQQSPRPFLSGLCGGEFLGGQFYRVVPSQPNEWLVKSDRFIPQDLSNLIHRDAWVLSCANNPETWYSECARIFLVSSRSTIYESITGSWSAPYELTQRTVSPFTSPPFLKLFLSTPLNQIGDYDLYSNVFKLLGEEIVQIPLSSQFTLKVPEYKANSEWGREPKAARPMEKSNLEDSEIVSTFLEILKTQNYQWPAELLTKALTDKKIRINLISLYYWLTSKFQIH